MTDHRKRPRGSGRFLALLGIIILGLVAVGGRLVQLHVVDGPAYAAMAAEMRTRDVELSPRRGSIIDRDGEPLAVTMDARTVYAVPSAVKDPEAVAVACASILGGDADEYEDKLTRDVDFVYIARKTSVEKASALQALGLEGLGFLEDSRRVYPSNELACQVLGFVGVDDVGLAGLEKQYDALLGGMPGRLIAEKDPAGRPIPGGVTLSEEPVDGQDLHTTLDKDIQYQVHIALAEAVEMWGAKGGSIIVMDPRDGSIYAMASVPYFDPNTFGTADQSAFRNRPIVDTYEPGSTIKAITASAVIEEGMYAPSSEFVLPPTLKVADRTIHESHPRGTVTWTLAEIVTKSSNVGAVRLGLDLGEERLYEYFERFGLTDRTGVDFPGEAKGIMPEPEDWSASTIGNIPFGQGLAVSPLQLARAMAVIANGGMLVTPHFNAEAPEGGWSTSRAISEETAALMSEILSAVVTDGTGSAAAVEGYEVAGKTGTAQKARTDGPGYATGKYVASFSGYLPADDPQVLIIVIIDEPTGTIYGGSVAAPTFSRIARYCVEHLKIPPSIDEPETSTEVTVTVGAGGA